MSSALHNKPLAPTRPKESAPEVLSYRQRLYDRETLMLPNEPWNPQPDSHRYARANAR